MIIQGLTNSFKAEMLQAIHDLSTDTLKLALFTSGADLTPATTAYSATNEVVASGYTAGGVPTLEGVREKIETRYGTALGATELAEETPEGRRATEQYEAKHKAAAEKLEEIRASMRKPD